MSLQVNKNLEAKVKKGGSMVSDEEQFKNTIKSNLVNNTIGFKEKKIHELDTKIITLDKKYEVKLENQEKQHKIDNEVLTKEIHILEEQSESMKDSTVIPNSV